MYPTASAPQYAFGPGLAPVPMPGMASGGLASLPVKRFQDGGVSTAPRYSYNPVTQSYTLLTPEQQANQMMAAQKYDYDGGGVGGVGSTGSTSSGTVGSSGTLGGIAQGVNAAVSNVQSALGPVSMAVPGLGIAGALSNMGVNQAMNVNEQVDAALAAANQQANQATVTMGPFGPQVTTAVDISPVTVNPVDISPLAALTAMNQQQTEEETQVSPVDVAMDTVASFADTQDAEAGATAAANAAAAGTTGGGGGGDAPGAPGDAPSIGGSMDAAGTNDSGSEGVGSEGASNSYQYGGRVMNYEQGGLAAAQQAQSKGRGQDTMLVHMTPKEVGGLQALAMAHGGSLTINPQTGLPEAGFLSRILPALLGAGLTIASGGALTPLMAAGIVGGGYGVAKGSLKEGLMAGLGAYGGAGLGAGLTAAGATTAEGLAATEAAKQATGQALADEAAKNAFLETGVSNATLPPVSTYAATATPAQIAAQQGVSGNLAMAGRGLEGLMSEQGRTAFMGPQGLGSAPYSGTASVMTAAQAMTPEPAPLQTSISNIRPYKLDITNPSGTPQYTPQDTREREQVRYAYSPQPIYQAAQGGLAALNGQTYDDEYGRDEYKAGGQAKAKFRSLKGEPYYKFADSRRDQSMEAAIEQNFAKGGLPPRFLSGGGDGMSDSIKANIDGKQEARLADGEFVVPADVVSHLGNGSSKAGAKKLYAMMDKIRKARTGRTRQAPEVNPNRYMPA